MISQTDLLTAPLNMDVLSALKKLKDRFPIETTSFDGRPFLIPTELGLFSTDKHSIKGMSALSNSKKAKLEKISKRQQKKKEGNSSNQKLKKSTKKLLELTNVQNYDQIAKKVKPDETMSNSSTQCEDGVEENGKRKGLSISPTLEQFPRQASDKGLNEQFVAPQDKERVDFSVGRKKRILEAAFDEAQQNLIFKVECELSNKQGKCENLTRDEILSQDPKLLLYFYENHIQFAKTPGFKPEGLRKL